MKQTQTIISVPSAQDDADGPGELAADYELRPLAFGPEHHGLRLDRALVALVPEFSRSYLQQLIDAGAVTVNGATVGKASVKVRCPDTGTVELRPTPQSQAFKAEQRALDIVYADDHLLVVNKPAGLVVHPAPGNWSGTLMNALLGHDARAFDLPRAGIVHRLDKDTSGLMVVARDRATMDALVRAIAARDVKRQYLALAHGQWLGPPKRQVDAPIGRDPVNRLRMAIVDTTLHAGKSARTDLELLAGVAQGCLVRCTLHTGRTHQIRVHMASIGHPLLADPVYGGAEAAGMQRQALHAEHLAFAHPLTGVPLAFRAALPDDFQQALVKWGLKYNKPIP